MNPPPPSQVKSPRGGSLLCSLTFFLASLMSFDKSSGLPPLQEQLSGVFFPFGNNPFQSFAETPRWGDQLMIGERKLKKPFENEMREKKGRDGNCRFQKRKVASPPSSEVLGNQNKLRTSLMQEHLPAKNKPPTINRINAGFVFNDLLQSLLCRYE
eukprot:TRINITY_DN10273_c0_g1_i1.p1 TRINITY_DN10273_c0_g1~~TRINITY_DN10273_c0_g1_i1.p1  ORF type:complete len:156 (-),score=11.89 TRINITY_DN10273_c0_g1_i1:37-504(-)